MMKKIKYWLAAVAILLPFVAPLTVFAAYNDVTTDGTASFVLPGNGLTYTLFSLSKAVSYTVNDNSFNISMDNGSVMEISSPDKTAFAITNFGDCVVSNTCGAEAYAYVKCTSAQTVTITPGAINSCTGTSGGGTSGGGGGGGGGGASIPAPVATTPVVTTPASTTSTVTTIVHLAPTPAPAASVAAYTFTKFLQRGSKGEEVKQLQLKLQDLGFFPSTLVANGYFGPATQKAVLAFQKANSISAVGFVGPQTRKALNGGNVASAMVPAASPAPVPTPAPAASVAAYTFTKFLQRGSKGEEVKQLQLKLQDLGFFPSTLVANGYFGPATQKAVLAFQKANSISAVGFVGPQTRGALNAQ